MLAAGLLASLAVAWPLPQYDYGDDYYGDDYYLYETEGDLEAMPVDNETPGKSHGSHHQHHNHHSHMEPETLPEKLGGNELGSPQDFLLEEVEGKVQDSPEGAPALGEETTVLKGGIPVAKIPSKWYWILRAEGVGGYILGSWAVLLLNENK